MPTGDVLSSLIILDSEPEWNDAVSLAAQVIPTCITFRWTIGLSTALADIDKQLRQLGGNGIRDSLSSIAPLLSISTGTGVTFAKDAAQLVVSLTAITRTMLQRHVIVARASRSTLVSFNRRITAFGVVTQLVEAVNPLCSLVGVEWPAPPVLKQSTNRRDMLTSIEMVSQYEEAAALLMEALP